MCNVFLNREVQGRRDGSDARMVSKTVSSTSANTTPKHQPARPLKLTKKTMRHIKPNKIHNSKKKEGNKEKRKAHDVIHMPKKEGKRSWFLDSM